MTEDEYEELLERIKRDLYEEFINPETASYGIRYVEGEPELSDTDNILSDKEILQDELGRLCMLQNKFVENEDYEKAELMKTKIYYLQDKIDKL